VTVKILFVNPHYPYDPFKLLLHPPLCYAYMAANLRNAGHEIVHADLPFEGNGVDALAQYLDGFQPDLVGVTCVAQSYCQALEIARCVHAWCDRVPIVMGGPHVTFIAEEVLARHPVVDYVMLFDADELIVELAAALQAGASTAQLLRVPGLALRTEGRIVVTDAQPPMSELDRYPLPDRSIFDMRRYLDYDYETVVMTARGCPSRCTFCSTTQAGRRFRWHGVDRILLELEQVLGMGFSSIFFGDDTFSGNSRRTIEFSRAVRERGLQFDWTSNMRAIDARPPVLEAVVAAGGYRVFMGFESIRADTLKLVKKGATPEKLYNVAQLVKSFGLELHTSFIVGAPGDTDESLRATLDFIRIVDPTVATFNVMEPRPGTDVYAHPERYGLHIPDPFWYETAAWVHGPVCYTDTLDQLQIAGWVSRCYDTFCGPDFRSNAAMHRLAPVADKWEYVGPDGLSLVP